MYSDLQKVLTDRMMGGQQPTKQAPMNSTGSAGMIGNTDPKMSGVPMQAMLGGAGSGGSMMGGLGAGISGMMGQKQSGLDLPPPTMDNKVPPRFERWQNAQQMIDGYQNNWSPNPVLGQLLGRK